MLKSWHGPVFSSGLPESARHEQSGMSRPEGHGRKIEQRSIRWAKFSLSIRGRGNLQHSFQRLCEGKVERIPVAC